MSGLEVGAQAAPSREPPSSRGEVEPSRAEPEPHFHIRACLAIVHAALCEFVSGLSVIRFLVTLAGPAFL